MPPSPSLRARDRSRAGRPGPPTRRAPARGRRSRPFALFEAARSTPRPAPRSPRRDPPSARRARRAEHRAGTRARERCVVADRPTAAARRPRRRWRTTAAAARRSRARRRARRRGARARRRPPGRRAGCSRRPCPRKSVGCCGTSAVSARQRVASSSREVVVAHDDAARRGIGETEEQRDERALPHSTRSDDRRRLAGADLQVEVAQHVEVAARVRERDALEPDRDERRIGRGRPARTSRRGFGELEEALGDGRSVRARVELRREVAERQVELRHEHEHGERRPRSRCRPRRGARPTTTATSAIPSVAASSRIEPERNATRSVPIVVRRYSSLTSAIRAVCARERLNARSVGSPRTTSRKWFESTASACQRSRRAPLGVATDEPHEHGHERQREEHHARRERIDRRDEHEDGDRHDAARTSCGR